VYGSSSGGRTAAIGDIDPGVSLPYLVSRPDPSDRLSPDHHWKPIGFSGAALARRLHTGRILDVRTISTASGRARVIVLRTDHGRLLLPAAQVKALLGLRSLWFSIGTLSLDSSPPSRTPASRAVLLQAVARALDPVQLEWKRLGQPWHETASLKPNNAGDLTLVVHPRKPTLYRLIVGTVPTPTIALRPVR